MIAAAIGGIVFWYLVLCVLNAIEDSITGVHKREREAEERHRRDREYFETHEPLGEYNPFAKKD